jgi:hypothetical protein
MDGGHGSVTARNWRPLVVGWIATAVIESALAAFVWYLPLAAPLVQPLYVVALLPGLLATWRWLRPRHATERRAGDRRRWRRRAD